MRQLRDFGYGKSSMEELIMIEVEELMNILEETRGQAVTNVKNHFILAQVNALWNITTGCRFDQREPEFAHLTIDMVK